MGAKTSVVFIILFSVDTNVTQKRMIFFHQIQFLKSMHWLSDLQTNYSYDMVIFLWVSQIHRNHAEKAIWIGPWCPNLLIQLCHLCRFLTWV